MRRKIYATTNESNEITNATLVQWLQDKGLDTNVCKYEMKAKRYERYSDGPTYTIKFACPGDWLAYFAMYLHKAPTAKNLSESWSLDPEDVLEYLDDCPTVQDICEHAETNWWGDGDDYIIYLKNLTTGKVLYESDEPELEYEEEDWED